MATKTNSASVSLLLKKSRVRVCIALVVLFFLIDVVSTASTSERVEVMESGSSSASRNSYGEHCNSIVPESVSISPKFNATRFFELQRGYYTGGNRILGQDSSQSSFNSLRTVSFHARTVYTTEKEDVLMVDGTLTLRGAIMYAFWSNSTSTFGQSRYRRFRPRLPTRRGGVSFRLQGFWSQSSGMLCMVGSGSTYSKEGNLLSLSAVFKLDYPKNSTIFTSLVNGTLESLDTADSSNYFERIFVMGISQTSYNYTLLSEENENRCSGVSNDRNDLSLGLKPSTSICSELLSSSYAFVLEYDSACDHSKNCSPLGKNIDFLPPFMYLNVIRCSEQGRMQLSMSFSNISYNGYFLPITPNTTLIGEGVWNGKGNQLCLVACRILNAVDSFTNASVGDCSINLSLRFPAILTIRNRSTVVGQIWSNKTMNDVGYFLRIAFRSSERRRLSISGMKYKYTEIDRVRNSCPGNMVSKSKVRIYPSRYSENMRFDMSVKNKGGQVTWGHLTPFFIGDQFYEEYNYPFSRSSFSENTSLSIQLNVSYKISFMLQPDFKLGGMSSGMPFTPHIVEISAEGIYDSSTGSLCMIGCRHLGLKHQKSSKNDSMDCEILVNFQSRPLNSKSGSYAKGTIKSMRKTSDPLFFEHLELSSSSIDTQQAVESIWRMDLEITMVLISNTLACLSVGLQLFYVKRHPDVLPCISLVMLIVLTLGHMIPLVLNFEALFVANRNRQNVLLGSGGWLEVNEVIVRIVTMVAFVLQFHLLQRTWSARLADGSPKGLWIAEKKSLYAALPLYLGGGLIAWFVHQRNNYNRIPMFRAHIRGYRQHSIWGDLRSYTGLALDGFLLPQILLNIFCNSRDKALAPSFYIGTTVVRLLPHAYDLYRAHTSNNLFDVSYIYANPNADFFSTAWDVTITCGGLLFAALIYLQQRFGGRCIFPRRFRESTGYEKVPVVNSE